MTVHSVYRFDEDARLTASALVPGVELDWPRSLAAEPVGGGIHIHRFDFKAACEQRLKGSGAAMLCIVFIVGGQGTMAIDQGPELELVPGTTVLFHAPGPVSGENRIAAGSHVRCLDLRFSSSCLDRLGMPVLAPLMRSWQHDCSVQDVLLLARPTPPALTAIAHQIYACRYQGPARQLFLQAKALEAFAHVMADFRLGEEPGRVLTARDLEAIRRAESLLSERYQEGWTIPLLARAAGTNERKLKEGFRRIAGSTVHAYLEERRLAAAAAMLASGENVTQAALGVGYRSLSHFAKRFQLRFGMRPSAWRRHLR